MAVPWSAERRPMPLLGIVSISEIRSGAGRGRSFEIGAVYLCCRLTKSQRGPKSRKTTHSPKGAGQGKSQSPKPKREKRRRKKHTQQRNMTKHIILRRSTRAFHDESTSSSSLSDSSSGMASSEDESTSSRVSATAGQTSADEAPPLSPDADVDGFFP